MQIRILTESEIQGLVHADDALIAAREAFSKLATGEAVQPAVLTLEFPEVHGELHGKGGYLRGTPFFSIKTAGGFYDNPRRGLPALVGSVFVFDAQTGLLRAVLLDNGFLTELRTAAAGALASDLLARPDVRTMAIIGPSGQARFQLEAHLRVRHPDELRVYSRTPEHAERYAREMQAPHGIPVRVCADAQAAVKDADLVITATSSRSPVVRSSWIAPGTHITAIGADMPEKNELEPALLARATVVADRLAQCATQGEIHHALLAGVIGEADVHAELGEVLVGTKSGRSSRDEITIADLTGVGALDAAIANVVMTRALDQHSGQLIEG